MRDHHRRLKWPPRRQPGDGNPVRPAQPADVPAEVAAREPASPFPTLGRHELARIVEGAVG